MPRSLLWAGQMCWSFQRRLNIPFGRERGRFPLAKGPVELSQALTIRSLAAKDFSFDALPVERNKVVLTGVFGNGVLIGSEQADGTFALRSGD